MDSLKEMSQFLELSSRIDLKVVALEYVRGLSGNKDGILLIAKCEEILKQIITLTKDTSDLIRKESLFCLINVSAEEDGAIAIVQLINTSFDKTLSFINHLLDLILDTQNKNADAACMALCNITRPEQNLEYCIATIQPRLMELMNAFTNIHYNKSGATLNYLGPLMSNLSGSSRVRQWLCEHTDDKSARIYKVASFCEYAKSAVRRGGAVGTLRNICFDTDRHDWLLGSEVNILPHLLLPLAGNEDFPDDEMDSLPLALQYLPTEKQREMDPDIRILLLETLNRLCIKRQGREYLRKNGTYYILRELHKWEKDQKAILACENVVDILIRKEDEMGADDITSVEVPEEYTEKFHKMDNDFINEKCN